MSTVLNVKNVSKSFKDKVAVRQASFEISQGEIFGLIGPANSGKSTIMRMVCGMINPSGGTITVCNKSIYKDFEEAMQHIGGSLENSSVYMNMTGLQNLKYYASLYSYIPNVKQRIESLIKFMDLKDVIKSLVKDYSPENLQKLVIAQALIHYPKLLILDEPTKGMSKENVEKTRNFLTKIIKKYNIGVLITSKDLNEMEILCDTVAVMSGGEILDIRTASEIKEGIKLGQKICIEVNYPNYSAKLIKENFKINPYAIGSEVLLRVPESQIQPIMEFLAKNNIAIFGVRTIYITFEDIYNSILRKYYKKSQLR